MAQIYDNIDVKFTDRLQGIISSLGVKRVDFCVGYFNLRGWNLVVDQIDKLPEMLSMKMKVKNIVLVDS